MHFNVATTISFSAAATCLSLAALAAYLSQAPASRHFRYVAAAGLAACTYCVTDAILAGRMSVAATVWAGRVGLTAAGVHGVAWLCFLAGWDKRALSGRERALAVVTLLAGFLALVPGLAVLDSATRREGSWGDVIYTDPDVGPLGSPSMGLTYLVQIAATVKALRMSRRMPRAGIVSAALALVCVVALLDWITALHWVALPSLADPAVALVFVSIGSVVVSDAAESAAKTVELERARVALAERENLAALGQLAAVVAHEVRNPVAIIFGALGALRRRSAGEEDEKLLGIVGEEAERLRLLVTRLLDAVRPFDLQYSRRGAAEIVRTAIAQVTAGSGVAPGEVELVTATDAEVECDEVLLSQAISNLVQNALVASGRRSPVRVHATVERAARSMLRIEIADDGDGVPLEARPRLFTPFFTTRATGTGLGLALVKRIAGAHGGTVDYQPPPDRGASFVLRVPLSASGVSPRRLLGDDIR